MPRVHALLLALLLFGVAACGGGSSSVETPTPVPDAATTPTRTIIAPESTATIQPIAPTPPASPSAAPSPTATLPPSPTATATATPTPSPTLSPTATLTATPTATPTPIPAPASQAITLPDIDAHYQLDIRRVEVHTGIVEVSETITIREFRGEPPVQLFLQVVPVAYGFFTLDSATLDGTAIELGAINDGFTRIVPLPDEVTAPLEIGIEFRLRVGAEPSGWGQTALDGGVLRLGNWFPIISDDHGFSATLDPTYTATAEFDVTMTIGPDIAFAHTGEITGEEFLDDGNVRYSMHADNVRDFALALSRAYSVDTAISATGVEIELYTTAADQATRQLILDTAVDAIDQLSDLIGPYPYQTFRIADAGPSMPGGIEFPGLIYINPVYQPLDRLIYHEVAHQWLYGIIGTRTLIDGWIDEGGAEFFERGLATGFTERPAIPDGGYRYPLDSNYRELPEQPRDAWYYAIYEQGARFYYQVMDAMGEEAFWESLRALYDQHRFGIATAWDVLLNWQRHSPTDLRPLYRDYFRYDWIDQLPGPRG